MSRDRVNEYYMQVKSGKIQSQNVVITTTSMARTLPCPQEGYSVLLQEKQELECQVYVM